MSDLPLPQLYAQTLTTLDPIFSDAVSLSAASTQSTLADALEKLHIIQRSLNLLGVYSDNEGWEELSEGALVFMTIGWVVAGCEEKRTGERKERVESLKRSEDACQQFVEVLTSYGIITPEEKAGFNLDGRTPSDPASRRDAKIQQYRKEKDLKERISAKVKRSGGSSHISFILALLPAPPRQSSGTSAFSLPDQEPEHEQDRHLILDVLRLLSVATYSALSSIKMELDILSSAHLEEIPSEPSRDPRQGGRGEEDTTWRLDALPGQNDPANLIAPGGKVLKPFTILPSASRETDRQKLKGEVFRQGWRLPTMTIDQYLQIEQERGGIISGGGQASYDAPTESETLELEAEMDGTVYAAEQAEKKRLKDENWAAYTDENQKGAGNTTNKG
ncbi:hypothetical protein B9479_004917 [Cryptococcus floricola]|uniref:TAP42-like protein n=1 Tax=Cryptococcus floricola TaxID=2591691 RepID=A0A5D3ASC6_9TREE|nr:hypothetical protein B9479_004917 [Cryptococcus floricola]